MNKELEQSGFKVIEAKKSFFTLKDILTIVGFIAGLLVFYGNFRSEMTTINLRMQFYEKNQADVQSSVDKINTKLDNIQGSINDLKVQINEKEDKDSKNRIWKSK